VVSTGHSETEWPPLVTDWSHGPSQAGDGGDVVGSRRMGTEGEEVPADQIVTQLEYVNVRMTDWHRLNFSFRTTLHRQAAETSMSVILGRLSVAETVPLANACGKGVSVTAAAVAECPARPTVRPEVVLVLDSAVIQREPNEIQSPHGCHESRDDRFTKWPGVHTRRGSVSLECPPTDRGRPWRPSRHAPFVGPAHRGARRQAPRAGSEQ